MILTVVSVRDGGTGVAELSASCFFRGDRDGQEGESQGQRPQRGRGVLQRLPAVPAGLRLLPGRDPLRGAGGRRPAPGRGLRPVPLRAAGLRRHGARLPLSQEQGAAFLFRIVTPLKSSRWFTRISCSARGIHTFRPRLQHHVR